jgi:DNA polymerase III subunit epsilon
VSGYVALDFETANRTRASACALALTTVVDGEVADRWSTLIDPEVPFEPMNSHIHGLTEVKVRGAPTFGDLADVLQELLADSEVVVAHSAAFDIQVMRASAARYDVELPDFSFACTRVFARRWFPGWPSYALTYCTRQLGIGDVLGLDHHNPTWDAAAAAMIALAGFRQHQHASWADAAAAHGVQLGRYDHLRYIGCVGADSSNKIAPVPNPELDTDPSHPLYGMSVCFTGALSHYARREAAQIVVNCGGQFANNVTQGTDLLVVGEQDLARLAGHNMSSKMRKAASMAADGHPIEIIDEVDFYRML